MADPKLVEAFKKLEEELQTHIVARQKLEAQYQENKIVQKEFAGLTDEKIFKLIGPVLLPQDKPEATMNVDKRIEFIEKEIKKVEEQISSTQNKAQELRQKIMASASAASTTSASGQAAQA